jgi:hypothetical protein
VGQVMDVRIDRVGTFTLYGDPAVVGLGEREVGLGESDVVVETASLKG